MEKVTERQRQILYLLAQGFRQNELPAQGIGLSIRTIDTYLVDLRRQLDASNTIEAGVKLWLAGQWDLDGLPIPAPNRRDLTYLHRLSLARIAAGWSYRDIQVRQAYSSISAVRGHLAEARRRLNCRTLHQTVFAAVKLGLLTAAEIRAAQAR